MKTLFVLSGKGGVGKTTVAAAISEILSETRKVSVLDADLHGPNMLKVLGMESGRGEVKDGKIRPIEIKKGLNALSISSFAGSEGAVIWRGPLKHNAIRQLIQDTDWGGPDYLVVDLPPGTGDELISSMQLLKENSAAIIVSTPQELSLMDAARAIDFCRKMDVSIIGMIENMSGEMFGSGSVMKMCEKNSLDFLGSIPLSKKVSGAGKVGEKPVIDGQDPVGKAFRSITRKILDKGQ